MCIYVYVYVYSPRKASSSYLDVPRLHFTGQFRADPNTGDNINCNFELNNKITPERNWNPAGTNDFEFINTVITTVIDKHGNEDTESELLGGEIFSNENKPFAKIVDLDVDFQVSSIFGLKFGLKHNGMELFVGNWTPCVIVHDMWEKVKCTQGPFYPAKSICFGGQSTTKIVDIVWSDSPLISEFKSESQKSSDELQVSITLDSYSCDVFTIGRVYGTIGITNSKEALCVGGERKMESVDPGLFNFSEDHPCSNYSQENQKPWTYGTPFKFNLNRNVVVVDLSNALSTYFSCVGRREVTSLLDLGELHFGYILNGQIKPIGDTIPYLKRSMWKRSGIVEVSISDEDDISNLRYCQLVVFTEFRTADIPTSNAYKILFHSGITTTLLLKETEFFVRPMGYYMARLQHSSQLMYSGNSFMNDNHEFTLLVTKFGEPIIDTPVTLTKSYNEFGDESHMAYPYNAVTWDKMTKVTNETGHVNFKFMLQETIPLRRHYTINPNCTSKSTAIKAVISPINNSYYVLPIDGQVYNFYYCVGDKCKLPEDNPFFLYKALISILAFSTITYADDYQPTWVDDVKSIFEQQHHISYVMSSILDMSNFTAVTLPHNIQLLKYVMSKDSKEAFENDPSYMPTTRNLSPIQRKMILKWLEKPCFDKACGTQELTRIHGYKRCLMKMIPYDSDPQDHDDHFIKIKTEKDYEFLLEDVEFALNLRPLFGLKVKAEEESYPFVSKCLDEKQHQPVCNLTALQKQLQQAVQLEFYTIPLYITSLYSIIENHNTDAYQAIRDIVMQEMLHMVQVANILIATGGEVMIDDPSFAPSYPTKGLPGGVLRNLTIHLKNYNLEHVYNTFMGIELPSPHKHNFDDDSNLYTIGMFYKEIEHCIKILTDDIFKEPNIHKQVKWPWSINSLGTVHIITDTDSAIRGMNEIIEQGEGAGYLNPNQIDTGMYAHYYRFEELVCKRRLIKIDDNSYAFSGDPIVYDKSGVYPMIDDPNKDSFESHSRCYTQAKAFHSVYRNLLRVMQTVFNGSPDKIAEAVDLMETLQVHAKRCISTPLLEGTEYNCAPVWDYEWE